MNTDALALSQPVLSPQTSGLPHPDRRRPGISRLEAASKTLSHAVNYLVTEQLAGHCLSARDNRDAVALLCAAGRDLARHERRAPAQRATAAWLRGAALSRATLASETLEHTTYHPEDLPPISSK